MSPRPADPSCTWRAGSSPTPAATTPASGIEVDEDDLIDAVRGATGGGATWVKLIGDWPRKGVGAVTNFSERAMHQAVEVAHDAGCRVAIHAAAPNTSSVAVAAGIDSIEHGLFITPDDLEALGTRGGAWVPTIAAMESIRDMLGAESSGGKLFAEGLDNVRELLAGAPAAGVTVLAGTDIEVPHGGIATEALKMADYGLAADDVVHATTTAAYEYLGSDHRFEVGGHADVLFFDTDPATTCRRCNARCSASATAKSSSATPDPLIPAPTRPWAGRLSCRLGWSTRLSTPPSAQLSTGKVRVSEVSSRPSQVWPLRVTSTSSPPSSLMVSRPY